ncbi:MAG: hypothetical protein WCR06_00825 [bacterium]
MKKRMIVLALAGIVCGGCATTQQSYRTEVTVRCADAPQQYIVEFKVIQARTHGQKSETDFLSAPTITIKAGEEEEIKVCDEGEHNGVFCKALIKNEGGTINAATTVIVKTRDREALNTSQNVTLNLRHAGPPYLYRATGWSSSEVAAADSVEGQLRSQGKEWTRSIDGITAGAYVQDMLEGRQGQPKGRGSIGKVTSVVRDDHRAPVAMVDFGRDYTVGIFLSELSLVTVVPE